MRSMNDAYYRALIDLKRDGRVSSPRGKPVLELIPYTIRDVNPHDNVVTIPGFETNVGYAELETDWYRAATNRIDWDPWIERTWKRFSDDGEHVNSAYGHRIFGSHPDFPNQWQWVVDKLREDPDSRQAVMNLNYPGDKARPTKDFVCTLALQPFIRDGALEWVTTMRSQDLYYGTRNDVYAFTELQKDMAGDLQVDVGPYHHIMHSMHLYKPQWQKLEELLVDETTRGLYTSDDW